jgi:hypothetical protein
MLGVCASEQFVQAMTARTLPRQWGSANCCAHVLLLENRTIEGAKYA